MSEAAKGLATQGVSAATSATSAIVRDAAADVLLANPEIAVAAAVVTHPREVAHGVILAVTIVLILVAVFFVKVLHWKTFGRVLGFGALALGGWSWYKTSKHPKRN